MSAGALGDTWVTSGNSAQPEQVRTELAQKEQKILKLSLVRKMAESSGDEGATNTLGGPYPWPRAGCLHPADCGRSDEHC